MFNVLPHYMKLFDPFCSWLVCSRTRTECRTLQTLRLAISVTGSHAQGPMVWSCCACISHSVSLQGYFP